MKMVKKLMQSGSLVRTEQTIPQAKQEMNKKHTHKHTQNGNK